MSKNNKEKIDSLTNALLSIGIQGRDKRMASEYEMSFIGKQDAEAMYQKSDVASKIVDMLPEDMTREGFKITSGDNEKIVEDLGLMLINLDAEAMITEAIKESRVYGGSVLYVGIRDDDPSMPLDLTSKNEIEFLTYADRYNIQIDTQSIDKDVTSKTFKKPMYYSLTEGDKLGAKIHESRIIRFDGVKLPFNLIQRNGYWGDSVFSRIERTIKDFDLAYNSVAVMLSDDNVPVVKMEHLNEFASSDQALLQARLQLIIKTSSVINAVVLGDKDSYERQKTSYAGMKDILAAFSQRLVMASNIPHTKLLGDSPSGLGATGESEKVDWYDYVKTQQESIYRPALTKLINILLTDPAINKSNYDYAIEFNPLWQRSDVDEVDLRNKQAQTDKIYWEMGADEGDILQSRFGGPSYSYETDIDFETIKELDSGE